MARYVARFQRTAGAAVTVGNVTAPAASMRRVKIYDIILGSEAAPADNNFLWVCRRCTTTGTRTAVTPNPLDPADAACVATAGEAHTVEPAYTANSQMISVPLNQRATFRWVAAPGSEIIVPATANNGLGFETPTAGGAVVVTATCYFEE